MSEMSENNDCEAEVDNDETTEGWMEKESLSKHFPILPRCCLHCKQTNCPRVKNDCIDCIEMIQKSEEVQTEEELLFFKSDVP